MTQSSSLPNRDPGHILTRVKSCHKEPWGEWTKDQRFLNAHQSLVAVINDDEEQEEDTTSEEVTSREAARSHDQEISEQVVLAMRNASFVADLRQNMGSEWYHNMRHWKASQYEAYHYRDTYLRGDAEWRRAEPSPKLSSAEVKKQRAEYTRDWKDEISMCQEEQIDERFREQIF